MKRLSGWTIALALAFAASLAPARAEIVGGSGEIEVFGGWYWPDDDSTSLDDLTYGIRGGINFTPAFGMMLGLGYTEADDSAVVVGVLPGPVLYGPGRVDTEQWHADLSLVWNVNPDSNAIFQILGGIGYAERDVTFKVAGVKPFSTQNNESFTAHFGLAGRFQVTDTFYIRPEARLRWFDQDPLEVKDGLGGKTKDQDRLDYEATIAFGWALGQ